MRTQCDWCGAWLYGKDFAEMPVTIHRAKGTTLERRWAEEMKPTRHFCVNPRTDYPRMGLNAADLNGDDDAGSCYAKAIASIRGTQLKPPDMGMEWRLVPSQTAEREAERVPLSAEMRAQFERLAPGPRSALVKANVTTVERIDAMSDDQLLAIDYVGVKTVRILREIADLLRETKVEATA